MCDGILIKGPDGTELCLPMFVEVVRWRKHPDPDPFRRVLEDIATLATINQAIAHVGDDSVRGRLTQAIQESVKTISKQLPAGVRLGDGLMKISADHRSAV